MGAASPQENISITDYLVPLLFQASNVPDAAGVAVFVETASQETPPMNWEGSIVGISVRHNADLSGGVITWRPRINAVASAILNVVTDDPTQQARAEKPAGVLNFKQGDRLSVDWTKTGTVAPTTTDVVIILWVLVQGVRLYA